MKREFWMKGGFEGLEWDEISKQKDKNLAKGPE